MIALVCLLISVSHAYVNDAREFLTRHKISFNDSRSFLVIDPEGHSAINLVARLEQLQGKLMIILMKREMHFSPNWYAIYDWPDVRMIFFDIAEHGLTPQRLETLKRFDRSRP